MTIANPHSQVTRAAIALAAMAALSPVWFRWVSFALGDERYTYTLAAPMVAATLLWISRQAWYRPSPPAAYPGLLWLCAAFGIWIASFFAGPIGMTFRGAALALTAMGIFRICYPQARTGPAMRFAALSLLLLIPLPLGIMDGIVVSLQKASSEVTYILFQWVGVPVFRESQFVFGLPGIVIEVAEECSGIRSAMSLFVVSFVLAHMFFRSGWLKVILIVATFPISIFKNALRIVTLSWLGVYWDRDYLTGALHQNGGALFAIVSIVLLSAFGLLLRKFEQCPHSENSNS